MDQTSQKPSQTPQERFLEIQPTTVSAVALNFSPIHPNNSGIKPLTSTRTENTKFKSQSLAWKINPDNKFQEKCSHREISLVFKGTRTKGWPGHLQNASALKDSESRAITHIPLCFLSVWLVGWIAPGWLCSGLVMLRRW